jgi:hypothetical protein
MGANGMIENSAGFLSMAFLNTEDVTRCLGVLSKLERHLEGSVIFDRRHCHCLAITELRPILPTEKPQ